MVVNRMAPRHFENTFAGTELTYVPPRYNEHIVMRSAELRLETVGRRARVFEVKHLGYFNETGPNIKLVKIDPGARTQAGVAPCQQVRYVFDGEVVVQRRELYGRGFVHVFSRASFLLRGTSSRARAPLYS